MPYANASALALLALLVTFAIARLTGRRDPMFRKVSPQEAARMMEGHDGHVVVDVREPDEFAGGHIPDALNIPLSTLSSGRPKDLPDLDRLILVYCQSGARSSRACGILAGMGYANVVDFGGIASWRGPVVR